MILIFSNERNNFAARLNEVSEANDFVHSQYDNLSFIIDQKNNDFSIKVADTPLEKFNLIYLRRSENYYRYCSSIISYLIHKNVPFIDSYHKANAGKGKLFQMVELGLNGLPIPKTAAYSSELLSSQFMEISEQLGSPFIMKNSLGRKGQLNFLINDEEQYNTVLKDNPQTFFIFQEFIPNHFDYRIVTLGNRAMVLKKRIRTSETTHLNNLAQGARVEILPVQDHPELIELAKQATSVLGIDIAGVDIIISESDQKPYILEVNKAPEITDPASLAAVRDYLYSLKKS